MLLKHKNKDKMNPYQSKCKVCKCTLHQQGVYCSTCAYKGGFCTMCGKSMVDVSSHSQSTAWIHNSQEIPRRVLLRLALQSHAVADVLCVQDKNVCIWCFLIIEWAISSAPSLLTRHKPETRYRLKCISHYISEISRSKYKKKQKLRWEIFLRKENLK